MSTVRVYKSTDPGAPPHPSALRGSMAALLRACLVTGYGAMTPAGWEEPFAEAGNYAAFRQAINQTVFFHINDATGDADITTMTMAESLSDVQTIAGNVGAVYFGKQYSSTYNTFWRVIADEQTCYVLLNSYWGPILHGFGKFDSFLANDQNNSFVAGHVSSTIMSNNSVTNNGLNKLFNLGTGVSDFKLHKSLNNTAAQTAAIIGYGGMLYPGGGTDYTPPTNTPLDYGVIPMFITEPSTGVPDEKKVVRGKCRGLYFPTMKRPVAQDTVVTIGTDTFVALNLHCGASAAEGQVFAKLDAW